MDPRYAQFQPASPSHHLPIPSQVADTSQGFSPQSHIQASGENESFLGLFHLA